MGGGEGGAAAEGGGASAGARRGVNPATLSEGEGGSGGGGGGGSAFLSPLRALAARVEEAIAPWLAVFYCLLLPVVAAVRVVT
jgi:hypothetical protein